MIRHYHLGLYQYWKAESREKKITVKYKWLVKKYKVPTNVRFSLVSPCTKIWSLLVENLASPCTKFGLSLYKIWSLLVQNLSSLLQNMR